MVTISIVIPLFNKAAYVLDTLQALMSQLGSEDEIIVVDDCSTDDSTTLVERLTSDQVHLLRMPMNGGPATARNAGVVNAKGHYVLFFDADDQPHPKMLEVLRQCIAKHPAESLFAFDLAFEARGEWIDLERPKLGYSTDTHVLEPDEFVRSCLRGKPLCTASSTCVRTTALMVAGGFQDGLRYCEDPELWARLSARHSIVHIESTLAIYRNVPLSLSYSQRAQPGSVHPYVMTLLALSRSPSDAYHRLARSLITKNTVFSVTMGGSRLAMMSYLQTVKPVLPSLHFLALRILAMTPRVFLRVPFALRSRLARMRLKNRSLGV